MRYYMPQRIFDMCAVSAAKIAFLSDQPIEQVARTIANSYNTDYADEKLVDEITQAATLLKTYLVTLTSEDALVAVLTQMQFCIKHFTPEGKKRRFRLGGTFFNKERQPVSVLP